MKINFIRTFLLVITLLTVVSGNYIYAQSKMLSDDEKWINSQFQVIKTQASNLNPTVLKLSLTAYKNAEDLGVKVKNIMTIIDYSKPSRERRLWVVDLDNQKVLFNTYVAHGKNSGKLHSTSFSNKPNSLKSSFGVFVTDTTYYGRNGQSLRIKGLEKGVNDNVYKRHVVFHGSKYVSESYANAKGMLGRSWGCMAVSQATIKPLIKTIKNQSLVFAYYPDQKWLSSSTFLKDEEMSNSLPTAYANTVSSEPGIISKET